MKWAALAIAGLSSLCINKNSCEQDKSSIMNRIDYNSCWTHKYCQYDIRCVPPSGRLIDRLNLCGKVYRLSIYDIDTIRTMCASRLEPSECIVINECDEDESSSNSGAVASWLQLKALQLPSFSR